MSCVFIHVCASILLYMFVVWMFLLLLLQGAVCETFSIPSFGASHTSPDCIPLTNKQTNKKFCKLGTFGQTEGPFFRVVSLGKMVDLANVCL